MTNNRVVIFSNGIADFLRGYEIKSDAPRKISIPVKQDHLADVLASLNIFGDVRLTTPPSFRPANFAEGSLALEPGNMMQQLAVKLSGSAVEIECADSRTITGTVMGTESRETSTGGGKFQEQLLVVLTPAGIVTLRFADVHNLRFSDEQVQEEINKALQRNFQAIKPESTFIDLELSTEESTTEAFLQYTIPAAAWKISYRLRKQEDDSIEFQGFAIVDNNTDEDWNDFQLSVVTGEPITFSTDLADSKTPGRTHVNIVKESAFGAVEVEESMVMMSAASPAFEEDMEGSVRSYAHIPKGGVVRRASASMSDVTVQEVGDFCIYEGEETVSIPANRSAVIPVFQKILGGTKTVLHYKKKNHETRAFRSLQFINETGHSLERGACTVYEAGTYAGNCIMPATTEKGEALLPHALETGVAFLCDEKREHRELKFLQLSAGVYQSKSLVELQTDYHLKNAKTEDFQILIDHKFRMHQPNLVCSILESDGTTIEYTIEEKLPDGFRARFTLKSASELIFFVEESYTSHAHHTICNQKHDKVDMAWIVQNLIETNGPLSDEPKLRECVALQTKIDAKQTEIAELVQETERLAERQGRLRENIKAGGAGNQTDKWRVALGEAEDQLHEIQETTIPARKEEQRAIRQELRERLAEISIEWQM